MRKTNRASLSMTSKRTLWSVLKKLAQSLLSPRDAMFGRGANKPMLVHLQVMRLECLIYVHLFT